MWAAEFNPNLRMITTLLENGAKVDDRNKSGVTALMGAAGSQSES